MTIRMFFCLLAAALLACGCSKPYLEPEFEPDGASFPGVSTLLDARSAVDVVHVHGMCTHTVSDVAETLNSLLDHLAIAHPPFTSQTLPPPVALPHGALLYQGVFTRGAHTLRTHVILWSPVTTPLKERLCYDQTDKTAGCTAAPRYPYRRAKVNAGAKDKLLNDCLADAVIYAGTAREQVFQALRAGVLQSISGNTRMRDAKALALQATARWRRVVDGS